MSNAVGILETSTLGKIDIQGPNAREFLNRVYSNVWTKLLDVGKARYGRMCKEDGMVFDDGVSACLADNHFQMITTTTGGAARMMEWLEIYHQTDWSELKVYVTSVTDHWATMTLSGPNSRKLLAEVTDIDLDQDAFPFMTCLSDILPTGYHGAVTAGVGPGSTVYIAGSGPVYLAAQLRRACSAQRW